MHPPHHPLEEARTTLEHLPLPAPVRHAIHRTLDRSNAAGIISRPLLGALPLHRWVPQDVHSLMDHAGGLAVLATGHASGSARGRVAGRVLGLSLVGLALCTDSRLGLAPWVPVELHEVSDYAWGAAVVASPFALGWARHRPGVAALQVGVGLALLLASLVTDYRCRSGMHLGHPRMTDPGPISA